MLAVGVLVPLSFGRLGKSWRHAVGLKRLAKYVTSCHWAFIHGNPLMNCFRQCADNVTDTQALTEYWEKHRVPDNGIRIEESPPESPAVLRGPSKTDRLDSLQLRSSISDSTGLEASRPVLAPHHPALSLPEFVESFGPLIFPLYRASLLRKRILVVTEAPVQTACDYGKFHLNHIFVLLLLES